MVDHTSSIIAVINLLTSSSTTEKPSNRAKNFEEILLNRINQLRSALSREERFHDLRCRLENDSELSEFWKRFHEETTAEKDESTKTQEHSNGTTKWKFVELCLSLLRELKFFLKQIANEAESNEENPSTEPQKQQRNPKLNPDALSVNDQKTVLTCVQFIVSLGIYPNLLPGVGIPVEKRSDFIDFIRRPGDDLRNEMHLYSCLWALLDCTKHPSLGAVILSHHLGDILTGLIQLCFAPPSSYHHGNTSCCHHSNSSNNEEQCDTDSSSVLKGGHGTVSSSYAKNEIEIEKVRDEILISSSNTEICVLELQRLLDRVYAPLIIKHLLMIQGGMKRKSGKKDGKKQVQQSGKSNEMYPETPQWFVDQCGRLLSTRLMTPNGIQAVLRAVLDGPVDSQTTQDWRKCDMVAMVIASCPSQANSTEEYYNHISPQVLQLLHVNHAELGKQFVRVTASTIKAMLRYNSSLTKKYLLDVMMAPLVKITEYSTEHQSGSVVCSEEALTQCIEDIHKVYVIGSDPQSTFLTSLSVVIHPIFELYCFTRKGISHLRSSCQEILIRYLKHTNSLLALKCLYILAYSDLPPEDFGKEITASTSSDDADPKQGAEKATKKEAKSSGSTNKPSQPIRSQASSFHGNQMPIKLMRRGYSYCHGDSGGIVIKSGADSSESFDDVMQRLTGDDVMMHEVRALCLVELFMGMKKDNLAAEFFLHLMKELTRIVSNEDDNTAKTGPVDLQIYDRQANAYQQSLVILQLVALMCDKLGPSILKDVSHMLDFIKCTLQRGCIPCDSDVNLLESNLTAETLTMAFGMLSAILGGAAKIEPREREYLEELLPLLEKISSQHPDPKVTEMANDLRIAIATHGAVWSQQMKEAAENLGKNKGESKEDNTTTTQCEDSQYDEAFSELCDPLVPVRGHAMITIAKLLHNKHPKAVSQTDTLLKIFLDQLSHDDSYIYLAAIRGLVALSSRKTGQVLPHLAREFATCRNGTGKDKKSTTSCRSPEVKIKLGEALVKAVRDCGDLIPRYSQHLLSSLLSGVRDPDEFVRASSLSNIGEVCKLLRYSLGAIINEVFSCLSSVLKTDKSEQVRRSAVLVITLLLQGLGKDSIQVLSSSLKEIYHLLKLVEACDTDETTRLHAQAALGELDTIMRGFLFPKPSFSKKIQVLP